MIIDNREVGGYCGMHREILFFDPGTVIIMFHPLGNDDFNLEFRKEYADKSGAMESLKQYVSNTPKPSAEELGPIDNNWQEYEKKVNTSVIQLFKDTISKSIYLPDFGYGYEPRLFNSEFIKEEIRRFENGEYIRYVRYRL